MTARGFEPTRERPQGRAAPSPPPEGVEKTWGGPASSREALAAALRAVRPDAYAATRNRLDGAVTGLSPYITHGMLDAAWLLRWLRRRHRLPCGHKLVQELGWRAYFRHVRRWQGDAMLESLHAGPLPDAMYARRLPDDLLRGCTGVPVIDQAVRGLYRDGWLHNHARLWLASYAVHLRKVHWRTGADWMFGHLLDGDLASNHLSWQWVAGTASSKPYLFDAANVAHHAPQSWRSPGSVLDQAREALEALARSPIDVGPGHSGAAAVEIPALLAAPPASLDFASPDPSAVAGRRVWLMHPWCLRRPPPGRLVVAACAEEFHAAWPWSEARWRFVAAPIGRHATLRWHAPAAAIATALRAAAQVETIDDAHLPPAWRAWARPASSGFAEPDRPCASFSAWWKLVQRQAGQGAADGAASRFSP